MKKNSQIHLYLETGLFERIKRLAEENNITVSEICRRKLKEIPQLNKIESTIEKMDQKLDSLLNKGNKFKIINVEE